MATRQVFFKISLIKSSLPIKDSGEKYKTPDNWEFSFRAVKHINAPLEKDHIRLVNAAGKWKLISKGDNQTSVSYTWNGELLGDFPDFALKRAWKTQGNEIIHWITNALK